MPICCECGDEFVDADPDDVTAVSGDEVFDLIAEAARISPHAAQAYALMRQANPAILTLESRWRVIDSRKQGTA